MDVQAMELRGGLWIHRGQVVSGGPVPLKDVRNLPEQDGKAGRTPPERRNHVPAVAEM